MYNEMIKRLREIHPEEFGDAWDFAFACQQAMHEAADAIEELICEVADEHNARLDAEERQRWIPVSERLPEKSEHYLVHINCGQDGKIMSSWTQVAWFCKKFYWEHLHGEAFEETITHWMPLPQPPKEEGET